MQARRAHRGSDEHRLSIQPHALSHDSLAQATAALCALDADLAGVVDRLGVPPLWGRSPGFATLVGIILEQQVSIAAARTLFRRLRTHLGGTVTPECVAAMTPGGLRDFGLTRQKARYCHGLAARVLHGELDLTAIGQAPEHEARAALLAVPGIGPWTADIYLLMALRRPDVWPHGDLALAVAVRDVKRLRSVPSPERQGRIAAGWAPWRSVAARVLWSHYLAR